MCSREPNRPEVRTTLLPAPAPVLPAAFTYHYYPDGTLASMGVKSSALTLTNLREYSYRPDGLLHTTYSGIDKK